MLEQIGNVITIPNNIIELIGELKDTNPKLEELY